jgi:hypothetical protein
MSLFTGRVTFVANLETNEYFSCKSEEDRNNKLKKLFTKLTENTALIREDIGESRWRKTDHIVIVPSELNRYVEQNLSYAFSIN